MNDTSLDLIQIASPCPASWDKMRGDERVRFCGLCRLNVYDLSQMSRAEAQKLVLEREGRMCVRFFRREDGKVLTKDCPVGLRAVRQRLVRAVAAIAGLMIAMVSGTLFGGVVTRLLPGGFRAPSEALAQWIDPTPQFVMGTVACPPTPPPSTLLMGKIGPAETPLLAPTAEQLREIQQRLEE
jgi:hypothetical protein